MPTSVSKQIIEKWLDNLADSEADPQFISLLRHLAENNELQNPQKLQSAISTIEDKYAKDQNTKD